jgi:hypothetical protein
MFVEENDARVEAVENEAGIFAKRPVAGTAAPQRTLVCCT